MPIFRAPRTSRFAATRNQQTSWPLPVVPSRAHTPRRYHRVPCEGSLTTDYSPQFVSEDGLRAYCERCRRRIGLNSATVPPHLYHHMIRVPL